MLNRNQFEVLTSGDQAQVNACLQDLRQNYQKDAITILSRLNLEPAATEWEVIWPHVAAAFITDLSELHVAPKMRDHFYYAIAVQAIIRMMEKEGITSLLEQCDGKLDKGLSQGSRQWRSVIEGIDAAARKEMPRVCVMLGLKSGPDREDLIRCAEELVVQFNTRKKIYSIRRHYLRYFLKLWQLDNLNNYFISTINR